MTALLLDVYNPSNATFLGTLTEVYGVSFLDDLTIPGAARFQVDAASTADLALLQPRRVVRFRTGATPGTGDVFAAIVQDRSAELATDIEPASGQNFTVVTVECHGLLAWLGYSQGGAVLYPFGGFEGRQQNPRVFGWQTFDFDDDAWDDVVTGDTDGALSTAGWPDASAVAYRPQYPGDVAKYRRIMPALDEDESSHARMFLAATVRTRVTVWLDGQVVLEKPAGKTGLFHVDAPYDNRLDHLVAVDVSGGDGRWGLTWVKLDDLSDPRRGDWLDLSFDDSAWNVPIEDGSFLSSGWPDSLAVAYRTNSQPTRFRRTITGSASGAGRLYIVATYQTIVWVFVDGVLVLKKEINTAGVRSVSLPFPTSDGQVSVLVEGDGRWGLTWRQGSDGSGSTLFRTYDPATVTPAEPWRTVAAPSEPEEYQLGDTLRRTFDPAVFPAAAPWKVYEGGPTDWTLAAYDDSLWTPVAVSTAPLNTPGWPDPTATAYVAAPGRARYRRLMEGTGSVITARMVLVAQWQTSVRVYLDGTQVMFKAAGESGVIAFDIDYPAADSQVAIVANGGGRWGWAWQQINAEGAVTSTLRRTFDPVANPSSTPWATLEDAGPGVNVGFVMETALDEAQARGDLAQLTYDFDRDADSAGVPWTSEVTHGFRMQELGLLLDEVTSIEGEPEMTPQGLFRLWLRRGTDRTATVSIVTPYTLGLTGRGPQATRWIYETDGGFGAVTNAAAEAELGVIMEQFVQLGTDVTPDGVGRALVRQLELDGGTLDEVELQLPDDVTPYVDVFLGDTVTCVGRDGTGPVRLTSFEAVLQDDGSIVWSATGAPA